MSRKWLWTALLLIIVPIVILHALHGNGVDESSGSPRPPISLSIVYRYTPDSVQTVRIVGQWEKARLINGTVDYTFKNDTWPFPVTLAFPPICHYTYASGSTTYIKFWPIFQYTSTQGGWQGSPFPDDRKGDELPEFARKQREVVIPAGESVTFTAPFDCTFSRNSQLNEAFVFAMPHSPCKHPVVGTIYGKCELKEVAEPPSAEGQ